MPSSLSNSIMKSGEILGYLSGGVNKISDLSIKIGLSKSSTHRLLKSLEASRLVVQDPLTRQYFLGPRIFELASQPLCAHENLILAAAEGMKQLRDSSGETVGLYVRIGLERICLEEVPSPQNIKHLVGKGRVLPLYAGSSGKVLLAGLDDDELHTVLSHLTLRRVTHNTPTRKQELRNELDRVRREGYATSFSEAVLGGASICVPIKGYVCPVALAVMGPDNRFTGDVMMELLDDLRRVAERIFKRIRN